MRLSTSVIVFSDSTFNSGYLDTLITNQSTTGTVTYNVTNPFTAGNSTFYRQETRTAVQLPGAPT